MTCREMDTVIRTKKTSPKDEKSIYVDDSEDDETQLSYKETEEKQDTQITVKKNEEEAKEIKTLKASLSSLTNEN